MNIVNQLTLRHLKQNKRRTLVTIIGVVISVAMITAVTTLGVSFLNMLQRQEIADNGEWHVLYEDVNAEQLSAIREDEATKTVVLTKECGYALLNGSKNKNKPYLFLKKYSTAGFEKFPIQLSAGRLPQNENEIVISEEIAQNAKVNFSIGEEITLGFGQRIIQVNEREMIQLSQSSSLSTQDGKTVETLVEQETATYTVVGTISRPAWEPTWAPGYTIIGFIDESSLDADDTFDAAVIVNKLQRSIYSHAQELASQNNIRKVSFHNSLLRFYGVTSNDNLWSTLLGLTAIILIVILVGSVSLIYNAFAISVSERSRHLGMLSSVGATKTQKRNSVFFEGMVIGLISIPLGIIGGIAGIAVTFSFINSALHGVLGVTEKLMVTVTPLSLLSACVVSIITIFVSTYLPARKASRISAIDAIRQSTDLKLTGKTVKTTKLIRMLFGIEAEIGLKNVKRNRRRYQATVFSLIISIVLFLTVSFFTESLAKSLEMTQDNINYDIRVSNRRDAEMSDEFIEQVTSRSEITAHVIVREIVANTWLDGSLIANELKDQLRAESGGSEVERYPYYLEICALNPAALKAFAEDVGADYEQLVDPQTLGGIVLGTTTYRDPETGKYVETKSSELKTGHGIDVYYRLPGEDGEEQYIDQIKVVALTDEGPMGVYPAGLGGLVVIISEETLERLVRSDMAYELQTSIYLKSSDPMVTQYAIEEMPENDSYVYNLYQSRQRDGQMILLMSVFAYGFIVLITAICIANIFNTISTSIALRKREFAMLKSVGMTPKGFNKMINYESIFYGLKSLAYGLPLSLIVMVLIYRALMNTFSYGFALPWMSILFAVVAVFVIVSSAMLYSGAKVKKENIIDALKQESI